MDSRRLVRSFLVYPLTLVAAVALTATLLRVSRDFALIMFSVPVAAVFLYALSTYQTQPERDDRTAPSLWSRLADFAQFGPTNTDTDTDTATPTRSPALDDADRQDTAKRLLLTTAATFAWTWLAILAI